MQVYIAIVLRLSGLFAYPDGFQHKGVRITEVLLYNNKYTYVEVHIVDKNRLFFKRERKVLQS